MDCFFQNAFVSIKYNFSGILKSGDVVIANGMRYFFLGSDDDYDYFMVNDYVKEVIKKIKKGIMSNQKIRSNGLVTTRIRFDDNFESEMKDNFLWQKREETGDFSIRIHDKQNDIYHDITCHSAVLLSGSKYFRNILCLNGYQILRSKVTVLDSRDVCPTIFMYILQFLYFSRCMGDLNFASYIKLYKAADYLLLENFKAMLKYKLVELNKLLDLFNDEDFSKICVTYLNCFNSFDLLEGVNKLSKSKCQIIEQVTLKFNGSDLF